LTTIKLQQHGHQIKRSEPLDEPCCLYLGYAVNHMQNTQPMKSVTRKTGCGHGPLYGCQPTRMNRQIALRHSLVAGADSSRCKLFVSRLLQQSILLFTKLLTTAMSNVSSFSELFISLRW